MGGSGIAKRLLDCVDAFVGHIKSGLGVVAVLVCAIMGSHIRKRIYGRGGYRPLS